MAHPAFVEALKQRILAYDGVVDPQGVHHEFSHPGHGQKLDMDAIPTDSALFLSWMSIVRGTIRERYPRRLPRAVLGTANGANRLAEYTGALLGIESLYTEKISSNRVALTPHSRELLEAKPGGLVLVLEDVGTTGGTALTAAESALEAGADEVEGLFSMQRTPTLAAFDAARIAYMSIMHHEMPTFSPEDCAELPEGFCAQGWELIPHSPPQQGPDSV